MNCSFKIKHYEETLAEALKQGYEFLTFKEAARLEKKNKLPKKLIVLRHDIDYNNDVQLIPNFRKVEDKLEIPATYFIRLHGQYNPFSVKSYPIIRGLLKKGHEVGLHYELDFASLHGEQTMQMLKRDIKTLEQILNTKVEGLAYHEPCNCGYPLTEKDVKKLGLSYEAYNKVFFGKFKYISDGGARWREGCLCEWLGKEDKLTVLYHPVLWHKKSPLQNY